MIIAIFLSILILALPFCAFCITHYEKEMAKFVRSKQ